MDGTRLRGIADVYQDPKTVLGIKQEAKSNEITFKKAKCKILSFKEKAGET